MDIIAFANGSGTLETDLEQAPAELPSALTNAATAVAEDLHLAAGWLNTGPALQWQSGLPPDLATRIEWRSYGGLRVGIVGRRDLIFLKLFAALDDRGEDSVHFQDLLALKPNTEELLAAGTWVSSQDVSQFRDSLAEVIRHVRNKLELE